MMECTNGNRFLQRDVAALERCQNYKASRAVEPGSDVDF
jgi:hypothetical protein